MIIRPVGSGDIDRICRHREQMFREAGRTETELAAMASPFRLWLAPRLADGTYFGFIAEEAGKDVGGVGLMEIDWPPHPSHPADARRGYVLNVFVEKAWRRRGIARTLMEEADREFGRRGLTYAVLHATSTGRPLYEKRGWTATSEMAKQLKRP